MCDMVGLRCFNDGESSDASVFFLFFLSTNLANMGAEHPRNVWGEEFIQSPQKIDKSEHPNPLLIKSYTRKCMDLVKFKTAQMYKARNNLLPKNIWGNI